MQGRAQVQSPVLRKSRGEAGQLVGHLGGMSLGCSLQGTALVYAWIINEPPPLTLRSVPDCEK